MTKPARTASKSHPPLTGLYPGTFDPITLGHTDIILRATKVVHRLIIGVADNAGKDPLFNLKDRVRMVEAEVKALKALDVNGCDIEVRPFKNLLIEFAQNVKARVIIRGLRAVSDFEYEFQMAAMNRKLSREVETIFLMSSDKYQFISSRFVKEIGRLKGDISPFVSAKVLKDMKRKLKG
jgi:pantetheine-phosphate adenylyltransferase